MRFSRSVVIDKLLNGYDTMGNKDNFILVYSEASDFSNLWMNYYNYISNINKNQLFNSISKLISFEDISSQYSTKAGLMVGVAIHEKSKKK